MLRVLVVTAIIAFATAGSASAATAVGKVARVQGPAVGSVEGRSASLKASDTVFQDEDIKTGPDSRLEIVFADGTSFTIGEKSSVRIDKFVFDPGKSGNAIRLAVVGPFRFVSGKLGTTGATRSVVTPFATIGIRGTNFWGGLIDGQFGVFLAEGVVRVTTPAGSAVLRRPGEGVNIRTVGAAPGPVTTWRPPKVRRAIATVTFR
jgi:hypothetical protein